MDSQSPSNDQYEKLKALHRHATVLAKTQSIKEIAEHTVDAMVNTLGFNFSANFVIVEDNQVKRIQGHNYNPDAPALIFLMPLDGPGIIVRTARTGETQLVNDTRKDADFIGVDMGERTRSMLEDDFRERDINIPMARASERSLSELDVPVKIDDYVVAVLSVENAELNAYNEQDKELLETLASHVASAIQRIRLLEAQIQYEAKLEALHQHAKHLADAGSIKEIVDFTVDAMGTTLGFSWAVFAIVEDNLLKFTMPKSFGGSGERWDLPLDGPGITVRTAKTGETQLIADIREDVDYIGYGMDESARLELEEIHSKRDESTRSKLATRAPALSELDVPVKIDQSVVAVIGAENTELNAFTEQDKKLLETLASHVASAMQRIRLLEAQTQYEAKLEALHMHANKLVDATSIEEIEEYTVDAMEYTLGILWARFAIVEDGFSKFKPHTILGRVERISQMSIDGRGIHTRAIRTGETQLVNDTRLDPDFFGGDLDYAEWLKLDAEERKGTVGRVRTLSELDVPVKIGQTVVAHLGSESTELNAFTEHDRTLIETLASHVASAMQRIRAKEEVRQLAYKLNNLKPGGCYLSGSHDRLFKAYAVLSMEGVPGLCIVRDDPQSLMDDYGIKKEEIVLLSSRPFEEYEILDDLQAVSRTLTRFLESGEGVVLLDGLEYMISRFGFDAVYSFVQEKRFDFLKSKAVLLVPLDMETIEGREKALLSSEFTLLE